MKQQVSLITSRFKLLEQISLPVAVFGLDSRLLFRNRFFSLNFRREVEGELFERLFDGAAFEELVGGPGFLSDGSRHRVRIIERDTPKRLCEITASALLDENGELEGVIIVLHEIRQAAPSILKTGLVELVQNLPEPVFAVTKEGIIAYQNEAARKILSVHTSENQVNDLGCLRNILTDISMARLRNALQAVSLMHLELSFQGASDIFDAMACPVLDEEGKPVMQVFLFNSALQTGVKREGRKKTAGGSSELLQVFDIIKIPAVIIENFSIIEANDGARALFSGFFKGDPCSGLAGKDSEKCNPCVIELLCRRENQIFHEGNPATGFREIDGESYLELAFPAGHGRFLLVFIPAGTGLLEFNRRVLEEKSYLRERKVLAGFASVIYEKLERMIAGITVDLQKIRGFKAGAFPLEMEASDLISGIAALRRCSCPVYSHMDMNYILQEALSLAASRKSSGRLELALTGKLPERFFGDPNLILTMLYNILENSAAASDGDVLVEVLARNSGGRFIICFQDDAGGFEPAPSDPFDFSTAAGMGLPLIREIARAHGGDVEMRTAVGKGTFIGLSFPSGLCHENPALLDLAGINILVLGASSSLYDVIKWSLSGSGAFIKHVETISELSEEELEKADITIIWFQDELVNGIEEVEEPEKISSEETLLLVPSPLAPFLKLRLGEKASLLAVPFGVDELASILLEKLTDIGMRRQRHGTSFL